MISLVESFLRPDKQEIPEEGRRIQRPKRCVTTIKMRTTVRKIINKILIILVVYFICCYKLFVSGGARGVMVIVVGNGHGDTSSIPR